MTPDTPRKPLPRDTVVALLDNLLALRMNITKAERIAVELFRHPDTTANQVMAMQGKMAETATFYRKAMNQVLGLPEVQRLMLTTKYWTLKERLKL